MKKLILFLTLLLFCVESAFAEADNEPLRIGLIAQRSGIYAANGEACYRGFQVAGKLFAPNDLVGSRTVQFLIEDDQSDVKRGVSAFQKLAQVNNVDAVVLISSNLALAVNPLSKRFKVPVVGLATATRFTRENPYAFGSWWDAAIEGRFLAEEVSAHNNKRAAIITVEHEYPLSIRDHFIKHFLELNGNIVKDETVSQGERDLSSWVSRIKAASPDTVVVNLLNAQTGTFIRQLREQGVSLPLFSNFFVSRAEEIKLAGSQNAEGTVFVVPDTDKSKFKQMAKELFPGEEANAQAYGCFAGLTLILQALKNDLSLKGRAALYKSMQKVRKLKLPDEVLPIRKRRIIYDQQVSVIRNGSVLLLKKTK